MTGRENRLVFWLRLRLMVEAGEWRAFAGFSIAFFITQFGIEFGRIGRDSYFIKEAGVSGIPLMYVFIAIVMIAAAPLYDRLVHRMDAGRLMVGFQLLGGIGLLVAWALMLALSTPPRALPYALFPLVEGFLLYLLMHFWTFANTVFDAWQGRRLFAYISGAGLLGSLIAGFTARGVAHAVGANHLIGIWAVLLLATIPGTRALARRVPQRRRESMTLKASEVTEELEIVGDVSLRRVWRQPLLRTLTFMTLPMWIIIYTIEYSYFDTASRVFADQDALAGLLGLVVSLAAAIGFVLQFTVTPWLLRRAGVGATSLVYPSTLTLGAIALLVFSLFPQSAAPSLPVVGIALLVIFARLCDVAFFFSVHDAAQQLLLYAVPHAVRDRARVLMHAVVAPISIAAAGGWLIAVRRMAEPTHNIAFMGIALSFLLMVLALGIAPEYLAALVAHLKPGPSEHREQVLEEIAKLPTNDARYVLLQSITSRDLDEARFAVERLFVIKDEELLNDIFESAHRMQPDALREVESRMNDDERATYAAELRAAFGTLAIAGD